MKRFSLAAVAVLTLGVVSAASAADNLGPLSLHNYGAPALVQTNWTGFYVGGNVGYGMPGSFTNETTFGNITTNANIGTGGGAVFGAQVGYNWQFAKNWIVGLETDFQWANLGGSRTDTWCTVPNCGYDGSTTTTARLDWFGTTRARLGYLVTNDLMVYGTGGVAYGGLRVSTADNCPYCTFSSETKRFGVGWTAGAGVEYLFADNWSAKLEYLHLDFGVQDTTATFGGGFTFDNHTAYKTDIVRVGLNHRF